LIKQSEQALSQNSGQLAIVEETEFVDAFGFVVRSVYQVVEDFFKVGYVDVLLD
jgi:hypothetical protein